MKVLIHLVVWSSLSFLTAFSTVPDDKIMGEWLAPDLENATIQVYKAQDGYTYGKIKACDKKEWVGEIILKKVKYFEAKNHWKGEVYSLKRKMSINVTITVPEDDKLKLVGSKWLMTKTFYWAKK